MVDVSSKEKEHYCYYSEMILEILLYSGNERREKFDKSTYKDYFTEPRREHLEELKKELEQGLKELQI